jgi:uncharacterized damage-inducible protein DinB
MPHSLVDQLRFTRSEFGRAVGGVNDDDAARRLMPMNCIGWNVGHMAAQEQRYFLTFAQSLQPYPEIDRAYSFGSPASTPKLSEMVDAWMSITRAVDPWLDELTSDAALDHVVLEGDPMHYTFGSLLLRVIYHYWYHTGEIMAVRQMLGHKNLPDFVGDLDGKAPYRPD